MFVPVLAMTVYTSLFKDLNEHIRVVCAMCLFAVCLCAVCYVSMCLCVCVLCVYVLCVCVCVSVCCVYVSVCCVCMYVCLCVYICVCVLCVCVYVCCVSVCWLPSGPMWQTVYLLLQVLLQGCNSMGLWCGLALPEDYNQLSSFPRWPRNRKTLFTVDCLFSQQRYYTCALVTHWKSRIVLHCVVLHWRQPALALCDQEATTAPVHVTVWLPSPSARSRGWHPVLSALHTSPLTTGGGQHSISTDHRGPWPGRIDARVQREIR